ncbi:MAG: hypothetical protein FWE27_09360 [Defluviitaleaceae bacterium]|nr:hypothetical protein [Defluviitaleaceae bacterium]
MLKRFLIIFAMFFAALTITGCIQDEPESTAPAEPIVSYHSEDASQHSENIFDETTIFEAHEHNESYFVGCFPPGMQFLSIEEFIHAYVSVRDGNASDDLARRAIDLDFASLDEIYLLTNLPESYRIVKISMSNDEVLFMYFSIGEEDITDILFNFTRLTYEDLESWGASSPLDSIIQKEGFTENDLIDEKYYFHGGRTSGTLFWAEGSNRLRLTVTGPLYRNNDVSGFDAADLGLSTEISARDMIRFAETVAVDLRDENNITALSNGDFSIIVGLLQSENITIAEPPDEYHSEDISQHNEISYDETEIYEPREQDELYIFSVPEELLPSEGVTTAE